MDSSGSGRLFLGSRKPAGKLCSLLASFPGLFPYARMRGAQQTVQGRNALAGTNAEQGKRICQVPGCWASRGWSQPHRSG